MRLWSIFYVDGSHDVGFLPRPSALVELVASLSGQKESRYPARDELGRWVWVTVARQPSVRQNAAQQPQQ